MDDAFSPSVQDEEKGVSRCLPLLLCTIGRWKTFRHGLGKRKYVQRTLGQGRRRRDQRKIAALVRVEGMEEEEEVSSRGH